MAWSMRPRVNGCSHARRWLFVEEKGPFAKSVGGETVALRVADSDNNALLVVASKSHRDQATDDYINKYNVKNPAVPARLQVLPCSYRRGGSLPTGWSHDGVGHARQPLEWALWTVLRSRSQSAATQELPTLLLAMATQRLRGIGVCRLHLGAQTPAIWNRCNPPTATVLDDRAWRIGQRRRRGRGKVATTTTALRRPLKGSGRRWL